MPTAALHASVRLSPKMIAATLALRQRISDAIERLIAALDALDAPGGDLEDDDPAEDGGDAEPSLGATLAADQRAAWRASPPLVDGEATGTIDDVLTLKSDAARPRDRDARRAVSARLRLITAR